MPSKLPTSDVAVKKATGKTWQQWFTLLNRAGAKKMEHRDIAKMLSSKYGVPSWWTQMVTVGYEKVVKGRRTHQKDRGYEVSVSKTYPVQVSSLYRAWLQPASRKKWCPVTLKITTARTNKSIRAALPDGTRLSIEFYSRGAKKSQVSVQHGKLTSASAAKRAKLMWHSALSTFASTN